jgi:carbon-monoxide dehydrogenase medium subunit
MRYEKPATAQEAANLLANEPGLARVLSGGTDVLVQLKAGMIEPDLIVDIKNLDRIRDITAEDAGFRIGAAVSGATLGEHEGVVAMWPGVVEAFQLIGSTQVQGRATMAGNLCNGSPAADSVPAMVAADATARIEGPNGVRDCPVIFLPARPERAADAYLRFTPRTEMDIAVASAAVSLEIHADGTCTSARVALGAIAPTVVLVDAASECIIGTKLDAAALDAMSEACSAACNPIDDKRGTVEFRTRIVGVLAKRAALIAYNRAGGRA